MYNAKTICDSISETGKRLTTFEITFPRIVLAEFNTHRMFSRNSASSRAIPIQKMIQRIKDNPFIPEKFPMNGKGMQPEYTITADAASVFVERWMAYRDNAIRNAEEGLQLGWHKQLVNRLLEPFMWHTVIVTATEWDNFFKLRTNEQAQYEIRRIADLMYQAYHAFDSPINLKEVERLKANKLCGREWESCRIKELKQGEWHLPFISEEDCKLAYEYGPKYEHTFLIGSYEPNRERIVSEILKKISVARCARVSYLTHDGKRDIEKDLELFEKLRTSGHWSPFEHVATPYWINTAWIVNAAKIDRDGYVKKPNSNYWDLRCGNFIGWKQFRKEFQDENCTHFRKDA